VSILGGDGRGRDGNGQRKWIGFSGIPGALFTEEETGCRYHDHCNPLEVVLLKAWNWIELSNPIVPGL
jgi:hypothetical protein